MSRKLMTVEELINELSKIEDKTMEVNFPYSHGTQENGQPLNVDSVSVFDDYTFADGLPFGVKVEEE